ncbi:MAG: hypothetical protein ACI841_003282 [Planctomycetota bacterium]|jgi:hypothetical protein
MLITSPLALLCCLAPTGDLSIDVLFLGNSYTAVNDLPALVQGLASSGGHTLVVDRNTPGGNTLGAPQSSGAPHMSNATSLAKIASQAWDFVVLQDQSYLPSIPWARNNYMIPGAEVLDQAIATSGPEIRVLMYQTWGRRFGGSFCISGHCQDFADFGEMQDKLTLAYDLCAQQIDGDVAPVGEAWRRALDLDSTLVLHSGDNSHPHLRGSYLAACVFYAKIFNESPLGLSFHAGLDATTASFLQQVANDTVFCSFDSYCDLTPNSASSGASIEAESTAHVSNNDMRLVARDAVPQQAGQFFYGSTQIVLPFGDGQLCVGGQLFRLGAPALTNGTGRLALDLDFTSPPMTTGAAMITAGTSWNFQFWFRDPWEAGGTGFNLSNAATASFCP